MSDPESGSKTTTMTVDLFFSVKAARPEYIESCLIRMECNCALGWASGFDPIEKGHGGTQDYVLAGIRHVFGWVCLEYDPIYLGC